MAIILFYLRLEQVSISFRKTLRKAEKKDLTDQHIGNNQKYTKFLEFIRGLK